jgi:hypothetical protein
MQSLIGYVAAAVVAAVAIYGVATLRMRTQEVQVSAVQYSTAKKSSFLMAAILERDLKNMGSNFPTYFLDPGDSVLRFDTLGTPRVFEFMGQTAPLQAPVPIRYEWEETGYVTLGDGSSRPAFEIRRIVDGTLSTYSTGSVTRLWFDLLREDGTGILNLGDTRQVVVDLRLVSALGGGGSTEEVHLETVVHPEAMTRNDFGLVGT